MQEKHWKHRRGMHELVENIDLSDDNIKNEVRIF